MTLEHCRVILNETHYPGNMGAAARVMRNMGLRDLVFVAPVADPGDQRARQMSTRGEPILTSAHVVTDLAEAIRDCVLVVGTSARSGGLFRRQTVGTPAEIMPRVVEVLRQDQPAALLFGPESTGLSDAVVTRCQHLIQIPTAQEYASLNLAQAVGICLYELRTAWLAAEQAADAAPARQNDATVEMQDRMFRELQTALEEIHFLHGDKAQALMHAVRHLLGKAHLSVMEVQILLGLARQIRWHVAHHPKKIDEQ